MIDFGSVVCGSARPSYLKRLDYVHHQANADYCVPESFYHHYDSSHYRKMLMDIGFKVIHCMDEMKEDILSNEEFRGN
ncbi:hypothetical protein AVEN_138226-1 [Araneus ventricosus]|uniref:Uncharacterized protein n=1 Tax=Araneus ventricosus TaxID=182803 RepID=A0A4Y2UAV5_ARAVE|nr:hypothetical protein AVEN_138226-1 [Araneus ventricosus]